MNDPDSLRFAKNILIAIVIAFIGGMFFYKSQCQKDKTVDPIAFANLRVDTARLNRDNRLLENTNKILALRAIEWEKVATRAQNEAAKPLKNRPILKEKESNLEESLSKLRNSPIATTENLVIDNLKKLDSNCDSVISKLQLADSALTVANKTLHEIDSLDSKMIANLTVKVRDVTEMNADNLKIFTSEKKKVFWKGFETGGLVVGILALIVALL